MIQECNIRYFYALCHLCEMFFSLKYCVINHFFTFCIFHTSYWEVITLSTENDQINGNVMVFSLKMLEKRCVAKVLFAVNEFPRVCYL